MYVCMYAYMYACMYVCMYTCMHVCIHMYVQPCSGEQFQYRSANVEDGARLDVSAESFWGRDRRLVYFDIKVFNPLASTHASSPLAQCYRRAELDKKRKYDERICEVERGTFSPLVFFLVAWVPQLQLFTNELSL